MNLFITTMLMLSLLILMMILLSKMISKKTIYDREKLSPFECGFNPQTHPRLPFSIQFFMISMLFLIFDIEIALMLPMIPIMKTSMMSLWWVSSSMFILILVMGLYYEWNQGMLKWAH
uniref:NADH-ubiquinone oxidoreductase chain 3 n=1 Tax=Eucriotettix oculatus TaxID=470944 RepID=A0A6G6BK75_9ORTH|nr:NADH dehydrogenase subunit 3 [Eucriotettix oculatus]QPK42093.1 NADH dehydrogenase subunit 3 [Eucriotettix oculatus]